MEPFKIILVVCLFCAAMGQRRGETEDQQQNEVEDEGNWKLLYKLVTDCAQKSDMSVCLKMKAVTFLDRAISMRAPLQVTDFVVLARDPNFKEQTIGPQGRSMKQPLSESQLEKILPQSPAERERHLDEMLQEKVDIFLQSRSLQLSVPSDAFEGRKKKKGGYLLAGGLAMAGMMAQAFMGKIALIAGKALLVAKIALVISAIVGLKKLVGGGGGGDSHPQVVYATGGHESGGWQRRSYSDPLDAHDLAYSAHKTEDNSED